MQSTLTRAGLALLTLILATPVFAQGGVAPPLRTGPPLTPPAAGLPALGAPTGARPTATPGAAALPGADVEFTKTHLAAALDVVVATQSAKTLDQFLPAIAQQTQAKLIQIRPDLFKQIGDVVQTTALQLAVRRADLDNSIARIWAQNFTEDELKAIATFYKSPTGAKLATKGPDTLAAYPAAVQAWSGKLQDEMMQASLDEIKKRGIDF